MESRKPLRLPRFDYSRPRLYFVTVCARRRGSVFGRVIPRVGGPIVSLNTLGREVASAVVELVDHGGTRAVASVVMPDHVHMILRLPFSGQTLGVVVGGFKAGVSRRSGVAGLWQRGYHDRVVRNERELEAMCEYIEANPARWLASRAVHGG